MTTTLERWFLAVTILAGLLTVFSPIPAKHDQAKVRMQAAPQKQLVEGNEAAIEARARLAALGQSAGPSNGSTMIALVSVADGSVRVLKTLPSADPQNVSRRTVVARIPYDIWCMIHFCKRWG